MLVASHSTMFRPVRVGAQRLRARPRAPQDSASPMYVWRPLWHMRPNFRRLPLAPRDTARGDNVRTAPVSRGPPYTHEIGRDSHTWPRFGANPSNSSRTARLASTAGVVRAPRVRVRTSEQPRCSRRQAPLWTRPGTTRCVARVPTITSGTALNRYVRERASP